MAVLLKESAWFRERVVSFRGRKRGRIYFLKAKIDASPLETPVLLKESAWFRERVVPLRP